MKIIRWVLLGIIVLTLIYVFIMNYINIYEVDFSGKEEQNKSISGTEDIKLSVQDSIEVQVVRSRFYGKIIEDVGYDSKVRILYLFDFLRIPLEDKNRNYSLFHIIFISIIGYILLMAILAKIYFSMDKSKTKYLNNQKF